MLTLGPLQPFEPGATTAPSTSTAGGLAASRSFTYSTRLCSRARRRRPSEQPTRTVCLELARAPLVRAALTSSPSCATDFIFLGFTLAYLVDVLVRLVGLGRAFVQNGWNLYDLIIISGTVATTLPIVAGATDSQAAIQLQKVFLVALIFKLVQRNDQLHQLFKTAVCVARLTSSSLVRARTDPPPPPTSSRRSQGEHPGAPQHPRTLGLPVLDVRHLLPRGVWAHEVGERRDAPLKLLHVREHARPPRAPVDRRGVEPVRPPPLAPSSSHVASELTPCSLQVHARLHDRVAVLHLVAELPLRRLRLGGLGLRPLHHVERPVDVCVLFLADEAGRLLS